MAANIKISSDAKQFQQEMQKITQDLKVMSSELGVATTKAELFGSEQDKLGAKSKELSNSIKGQNTILGLQKQTISALTGDIQKYKDRNTELSKSIAEVESKLKKSIKSTGEDSKETKQLQQELSKIQKEYQSNEKAIERSNKQMDTYKIKMNESEKAILKSKKALEETDKKLSSMKWDDASKKLEGFGNKAKQIGGDLTKKVTLPIIAVAGASVKLASDMSESMNKVDVAFGNNSNEVKNWSNATLNNFGLAKGTALDLAAGYGDMATSMGFTTGEASKMGRELVGRAADLSSFKNISIDVAKTALNGVFSGETESLKQLGVVMTQANLQEFAYSKGINKKIQDMTQAEQVQLRYNYVMEKTKNAQGDFAKTSDGVANSSRVTKESVKELGAEFGQNLLPMVAAVLKPLNAMLKSFTQMSPAGQKIVIAILALTAIIPPLIFVAGSLAIAMSAVTLPMIGIGLLIGAIVIAGALLVANWDKIKAKAHELAESIGKKWDNIKMSTENSMKAMRKAIDEHGGGIKGAMGVFADGCKVAWNTAFNEMDKASSGKLSRIVNSTKEKLAEIKGFFANLHLPEIHFPDVKLPHIPLPHFSVNGKLDLLNIPPRVPDLDVNWYAKGGIFNSPSIIGVGEAGAEGIIPLKALWSELGKNFDKLEQRLSGNKQTVIHTQNDIYLDGEKVGSTVTRKVIDNISREQRSRSIGKGGLGFV